VRAEPRCPGSARLATVAWMTRESAFVRRRLDAVVGLAGLAVLVVCAIIVRGGTVGSLERRVFEAINGVTGSLEPVGNAVQFLEGTIEI